MSATDTGATTLPTLSDVLEHPDRAARVAAIGKRLRDEDVRHVYCQYVTVQGRVLAKAIPTTLWEKVATEGMAFAYAAAGGLHVTRGEEVLGEGGSATTEGIAVPDLDTFEILPWDRQMSRVFLDHWRRPDEKQGAGEPVGDASRQLLAGALASLESKHGLQAQSGCEPEMSWFKGRDSIDASASRLAPNVSPAYHVRHLEDSREILKRVTSYCQQMGMEMIQADYEDPGQLECNFQYDDCLRTADRLVTYRQVCMQVADELGLLATFMPKPVAGIMANGCHHHVSLWRDGENALFDADGELSEIGRYALGGLLEHSRGMMALVAPTVNSYKRFLESIWAPLEINWGIDNRTCTVRVLPGRFEVRTPDASCNPYISHTAILAAISDGIERKLDPGPPESGDTYAKAADPSANGTKQFAPLPVTLAEALEALAADGQIREALPASLYELFVAAKTDEWERFCGAITEWDYETYLDYLP